MELPQRWSRRDMHFSSARLLQLHHSNDYRLLRHSPVTLQARYAALAEGITGQFYLAILVAPLVSMQLAQMSPSTALKCRRLGKDLPAHK